MRNDENDTPVVYCGTLGPALVVGGSAFVYALVVVVLFMVGGCL